ncbi:hypothetical protein BD311DRAFT_769014 [Dichomitus squalens]|uniref:Microbial-type PARG catalytic domain-containing protein n=1 Tax=Dichomitus squalens TaxID=114155 RepID=A0A4V2JZ08_9APHY|nr:hypothetical protein BD311DRAFT_769014 [Dichomitus squalens]
MAKHRARPSRHRQHRQRRAGTPSTPMEQLKHRQAVAAQAKRQQIKKQKAQKTKEQANQLKQRMTTMLTATAQRARRERWAAIALETQAIVLGNGQYVEERIEIPLVPSTASLPSDGPAFPSPIHTRITHNIAAAVMLSNNRTIFYPHYSPALAQWPEAHPTALFPPTQIEFTRSSTLNVARNLVTTRSQDPLKSTDIGVLSFASAKRPGGGYLHGSSEQEDTIARLSSLVASLASPAAKDFYKEHRAFRNEDGSGLHDHSMVYSPGVVVFRKDADDEHAPGRNSRSTPPERDNVGGAFISPYIIDVVSAVPVNAAAVHQKHVILPGEPQLYQEGIRRVMKDRMGRALRVFETHGDKVLILGAFGCGSFENKVEMIASLWAELLVCGETVDGVKREARFKQSFEKVVFAVPGRLFEPFKRAFDLRVDEELLTAAMAFS